MHCFGHSGKPLRILTAAPPSLTRGFSSISYSPRRHKAVPLSMLHPPHIHNRRTIPLHKGYPRHSLRHTSTPTTNYPYYTHTNESIYNTHTRTIPTASCAHTHPINILPSLFHPYTQQSSPAPTSIINNGFLHERRHLHTQTTYIHTHIHILPLTIFNLVPPCRITHTYLHLSPLLFHTHTHTHTQEQTLIE